MPRKLLIRTDQLPYHVTARSNNREKFPLPMDSFWEVIGDECLFLSLIYGVEFQSVVLMPNHIHAILTVPVGDLGKVMNEFMKSVSRRSNLASGRRGHVFGGSYHWSLIGSTQYYRHVIKYVYRNPVRAGLSENVQSYPYSTLSGLMGMTRLPFPLYYTRMGMEVSVPDHEGDLALPWLNMPFSSETDLSIKRGLRRRIFDIIKGTNYLLPKGS